MTRLAALALLAAASPAVAADPSFKADVAPLLAARCVSCHSGPKAQGGYKLATWADLTVAGRSGEPPVVPGKADESELLLRLTDADPKRRMPPDDEPLSPAQVAAVRRWVAAGATFDGPDPAAAIRSYLPPRSHPAAPERYPAPAPVYALAFSPDGREVAVGGVNEVTVWEPATGKLLRRLPGLPDRVQALAYSADGARLLVGGGTPGEYGEAALVDPTKPAARKVLGVFEDVVLAVAFSADGKTAVAGGADRTARAFAVADGRERWRAAFHSDWVTAAAVSPDGRFVATASKDRTVKVLDAATGKLFTTYNGHRRQYGPHTGQFEVYGVGFDPAGVAYSAGGGAAVRAWEPVKAQDENGSAADMEERFAKAGHTRYLPFAAARPVFALAVAGGQVFTAAGDGKVRQHDPASARLVREYAGPADWLYAVAADRTGARVAAAGFDGTVWVWDTAGGGPVTRFRAAPGLPR
ncbi:WD40 repeat domain-containing protein [Urbifossiella limnaea]|uniref:WD domain, G-beta repeat n=1 Tax=Urbifossiella limnaea TaxID=2528023 RepID=A0A517Y199_9BACT|nr:c-type cytochrome domain-containing protein [Urbifossiella limnaea]QDU23541.1 WD domain, G-beta repeat [Urbifossiella limnaea]